MCMYNQNKIKCQTQTKIVYNQQKRKPKQKHNENKNNKCIPKSKPEYSELIAIQQRIIRCNSNKAHNRIVLFVAITTQRLCTRKNVQPNETLIPSEN